ncbi:MAG: bpX6 domain-containing protein [Polyangiaceae bacterium]
MSGPVVRRPVHRGSVVAAGFFADASLVGEEQARRRILSLMGEGGRVVREGETWIVVLGEARRVQVETSPLGVLARCGEVLSSAPLSEDELSGLALPAGRAAVIVRGGEARAIGLDKATEVDVSEWVDVSDFEVAEETRPLGRVAGRPRAAVAERSTDVRGALGVPPETEEARAAREALFGVGRRSEEIERWVRGEGRGGRAGRGGVAGAALAGLIGRFFAALGGLLGRAGGQARQRGSSGAGGRDTGGGSSGAGGRDTQRGSSGAGGGAGRGIVSVERGVAEKRGWLSALSAGLRSLAMRMMIWSRIAGIIGRRQAEYIARMMEMFERGDLDEALRHAIPLDGGKGEGEPSPPALGGLSPRDDLSIVPHRGAAAASLYAGPQFLDEMRARYRRAFETLERNGEIEKAAFVLAELLGENEEAVSFLEKHKRFKLAAEIAEARGLADGLVVRQWFLAGDVRRAIAIARVRGAFADAVIRLSSSGKVEEAHALRIHWAEMLAQGGQYAAAADVIWPVEQARRLSEKWLALAMEVGGPTGVKMAVRRACLFPKTFEEGRDQVVSAMREEGEEGLLCARAVADEIADRHKGKEEGRALSRAAARVLWRSEEPVDVAAMARLAEHLDALTAADLQIARGQEKRAQGGQVRAVVTGRTRGRAEGTPHSGWNEDGFLVEMLVGSYPANERQEITASVSKGEMILGAFDGMGGYKAGDEAVAMLSSHVLQTLRGPTTRASSAASWAQALVDALKGANKLIYKRALADTKFRGAGATGVLASVHGSTLIVVHAGICRAYLLRGGKLSRLTEDHNIEGEYKRHNPSVSAEMLANVPRHVMTRAFGLQEEVLPEVSTETLKDGDALLLCTDGVYESMPEERLCALLRGASTPAAACEAILDEVAPDEAFDDRALVVARFSGKGLSRQTGGLAVTEGRGRATALKDRLEPLLIRRAAGDTGAIKIFDAAALPDGRTLVALGEAGAWVLSRTGKVEVRFGEPCHALVISDQGDRALSVAMRGGRARLTRLDLVRRRQQAWCHAQMDTFASTFDGMTWYVGCEDSLYAIDATQEGWEHVFRVTEAGARVDEIARCEGKLNVIFGLSPGRFNLWRYDLPAHKLRARDEYDPESSVMNGRALALTPWQELFLTLVREDEGVVVSVLDVSQSKERARLVLSGAGSAWGAFRERVVLWDDRGRLFVLSARTGAVIREARLA